MNPEEKPATSTAIVPAAEALKWKDQVETLRIAAGPRHENDSALRIRAALKVARSDEAPAQPLDAPVPQGRWIVKSLPRPPLVAAMLEEPPADELLANDSLGG